MDFIQMDDNLADNNAISPAAFLFIEYKVKQSHAHKYNLSMNIGCETPKINIFWTHILFCDKLDHELENRHSFNFTRGGSRISHGGDGAPTLVGGGANLRHRCFLVKTYIKTKEFGPVVGARTGNFCM